MLFKLNLTEKGKSFLLFLAILFALTLNVNASHTKHIGSRNSLLDSGIIADTENEMFVPGISLVKTATVSVNCSQIRFSFEVVNQSTNGEILENVLVTDPSLGGIIVGPSSGDDNNNTFLDPGETWIYGAVYNLTQIDIDNGQFINQANVTADVQGQPGVTVNDLSDDNSVLEDDHTITDLTSCQSGISLIKTGIAIAGIDQGPGCNLIIYQFQVANEGAQILENVVLNDPLLGGDLPGPNSGDNNNNSLLDINETWIYSGVYIIVPNDLNNGQVINQATVTADVQGQPGTTVQDLSDDNSTVEDDATIIDLSFCQPNIAVIKTGVASEGVEQGPGCNLIFYQFDVTNEGEIPLENIVLNDPLLGGDIPGPFSGDENNDSVLDPNEIWIYSGVYAITQQDLNNGQVVNQATVIADVQGQPGDTVQDLSDDNSVLEDDPTLIDLTFCQSDIAVVKTGIAIEAVDAGLGCNFIIYQFHVTNQGAQILENVVLNDPLLGGDLPGPDSGDDNNNTFLDPDETWIYSVIYPITPDDLNNGQVINQATATANVHGLPGSTVDDLSDDDSILEDDPTIIDLGACENPGPGIGLIKEGELADIDGDGCIESIRYTFTVTNLGDVDLDEVDLEDPLFGGNIPGPESESINENGILQVGEIWTYVAIYAITQADIDATVVINQATVSAEPVGLDEQVVDSSDDDSNFQDQPTRTEVPDDACTDGGAGIGLIKEGELADIDGDGCIESIRYTFTVTNLGDVDLDEVDLEDPLFGGNIPGPESESINENGILQVGEIWTYVALYAITQADIDATVVINQATVSAEPVGSDEQVVDSSDDDSNFQDQPTRTEVPDDACTDGGAGIGLIKEGELADIDGDGCIESIRYTFTVTNLGDVDLDEVDLEDPLFGGDIPGPESESINENGILQVGEIWTYVALYAITQADIDATVVINQATVSAEPVGLDEQVVDSSDDDSNFQDQPTRTEVPDDSCPGDGGETPLFGIAILKIGSSLDINLDGCDDSIRYDFTVINTGSINLEDVEINDELLGGQINGLVLSEESEDNILQPGEEWQYTAIYNLTQEDIDGVFVNNQASVTANLIGSNNIVFDFSDNDNYQEDDPTETNVSGFCADGGSDFEIFNGITPNGDGFNDYFQIVGIENYPNNNLKIFNRWGVLVYQADNYGQGNNLFRGISEGRSTMTQDRELPSGTYFYSLTFSAENPGKDSYNGYLYINRD
ncbi:hypothetical protein DKG77_12550 [Flagellimonas aquimarina]|uniref:DUF7507 domain-containing protein n=1 Tax=Flagellimonas aquimarina TaxID=2201895 RepID=A0A316KZK5_9FLAO|nr:gliding motility-associated C-terminal domain-containing protein [Allomuricauda koreensis]PWL39046.1 hypothetical protein DKG77_12550 [Allomuricauda koreensis]